MTMKAEPRVSDYRDALAVIFTLTSPDAGQVEWLLDRIEGAAEASR